MKRIIYTIFAAALLAMSAISCQKAEDSGATDVSPEVSREETISVSLTATMDELTPAAGVKSEVTPVIRLTWADEGDKVFVYDASKCLGTLDVTLKNNDSRYAYLSGTIEAPSDGTGILTCIHAKGVTEAPAVKNGKVTVSLADQNGQDADIPFVVFGTIDYNDQSSISDRLVNFSFATSVVNVNCIDLVMDGQYQEQIDKAYIKGLNTSCQLTLSNTEAPEVSGTDNGSITRKGITGSSDKLAFLTSVPVSPSATERELFVVQQSKTMYSGFTNTEFKAGKFYNVMYKLDTTSRVEGIILNKTEITVDVGEKFTLTATVTPGDAKMEDVIWTSSNEGAATVDANGRVTPVAGGTANITAKTVDGEKTDTCKVTVESSDIVLSGVFSVGSEKKVRFSRGNLKYTPDIKSWWFFDKQYEYGHGDNQVSLFTWGYGDWSTELNTPSYEDGTFTDWGTQVGDGETWRTLTDGEWRHLLSNRSGAAEKVGFATVCGKNGIIILPDDFVDPKTNESPSSVCQDEKFVPMSATEWEMNVYPAGDSWNKMEAAGALFLPAAGYYGGSSVISGSGRYWSASDAVASGAYYVNFFPSEVIPSNNGTRSDGYSVRLVTDYSEQSADSTLH